MIAVTHLVQLHNVSSNALASVCCCRLAMCKASDGLDKTTELCISPLHSLGDTCSSATCEDGTKPTKVGELMAGGQVVQPRPKGTLAIDCSARRPGGGRWQQWCSLKGRAVPWTI